MNEDQERRRRRELPPGSMTKARLLGFLLGFLATLLLIAVMTLLIIAAKVGNGYGAYGVGCCASNCCAQTSCCAQSQCRPQQRPQTLDRRPEVDMRGRPLPDAHLWIPEPERPDTQTHYTPPCACTPPPLVPWWPDWRGKDDATTVPEPGALALVGLGGLLLWRMV